LPDDLSRKSPKECLANDKLQLSFTGIAGKKRGGRPIAERPGRLVVKMGEKTGVTAVE
jgi:hypothetical protein